MAAKLGGIGLLVSSDVGLWGWGVWDGSQPYLLLIKTYGFVPSLHSNSLFSPYSFYYVECWCLLALLSSLLLRLR